MAIFLICPHTGQPRYHKRERAFRASSSVRVAAFTRQHYRNNTFGDNVDLIRLGEVDDGRYLSRIPRLLRSLRLIARAKSKRDLMYAFSLDCYLLGRLAGLEPGILEIGDLRTIDSSNHAIRALERWVLRDCRALVVTSPGFLTHYYEDMLREGTPHYLIENRLDRSFSGHRPKPQPTVPSTLRIGLIGLLRYRRPLEMLVRVVEENPAYQLLCYGDGPDRDVVEASRCERVQYYGPFRSPQDLGRIYQSVDVNFVVYDSRSRNVQLALPNKLYESLFFSVPILAAEGTELASEVQKRGIGFAVDATDYLSFQRSLSVLSHAWIAACKKRCEQVDESQLIDDSDEVIRRVLRDLTSSR